MLSVSASFRRLKRLREPQCSSDFSRRGEDNTEREKPKFAKVQEALASKAVSGHVERAQVLKRTAAFSVVRIWDLGLHAGLHISSFVCSHSGKQFP